MRTKHPKRRANGKHSKLEAAQLYRAQSEKRRIGMATRAEKLRRLYANNAAIIKEQREKLLLALGIS